MRCSLPYSRLPFYPAVRAACSQQMEGWWHRSGRGDHWTEDGAPWRWWSGIRGDSRLDCGCPVFAEFRGHPHSFGTRRDKKQRW